MATDSKKTGKVLLLLDNAPSHPSAETLNSIDPDFQVMYLKPNVTSLIQHMDKGVIEKMKRMYRKQVLRRLLLNDGTEDGVIEFSKSLNLKHCCYMIADAWDSLTEDNLRNAWKKLWILPKVTATAQTGETAETAETVETEPEPEKEAEEEPEKERESNTEKSDLDEFASLIGNIPGFADCDKDDVEDWLNHDANDQGYQILDDDEIVSSIKNLDDDHDSDSSDNESLGAPKKPSHAEAFNAFETGLEWFESQDECCPTQLLLLKRLRDLAAQKRVSSVRQSKIDSYFNKL
ncbi:jerky protein homolog-like [Copidosoma floridanum]|uniref:jerky protein homolog-like n=1 Tax=Copidosoma floridanum TaxID=29053 RepID=UPI000C6F9C01|nr:jerky protein homolog-like [Copidosoma floridanum]